VALVVAAAASFTVVDVSDAGAATSSAIEVRGLTVDVDRGLGSQFGGRVDVTVHFRVVNTGAVSVQPTARIELESQIGGGTTSAPIDLRPLAPGEHVDVTRTAGSLLPFGSAHVEVTVRADGEVASASASTPVIPWLLLLVGIVVVIVAGLGFRRARRAKATAVSP
jgi:hypothetical protein